MNAIRNAGAMVAVVALAGCYAQDPAYAQSTFPNQAQPTYGPPGGAMDPGYGYQDPYQPGYPQGYPDGTYADPNQAAADPAAGYADPSSDPALMGSVTDAEIDTTLQPYGNWVEDPDYGRVWRPDATIVGVDFTPYESCGSWIDTEYGWTFTCDWGWGWLPFHYGRWSWFDSYWGWVPGYQWAPAWVDWRHGGGYVGWRPIGPERGRGPAIRDHRPPRDSAWRFASVHDFGKPHVRAHLYQNPAEGLRVTQPVAHPPVRGPVAPVRAASLMQARAESPAWPGVRSTYQPPMRGYQPPMRSYQPPAATYQPPVRSYQPPVRSYQPPVRNDQPPVRTYQPPTYQPPTYQPPVRTYQPPTYQPPVRTYQPPAHSSWSPPSHSSFSPPSHSSFSPPSHSSSSGGGGHSSGSSSHSSNGGGGHHR